MPVNGNNYGEGPHTREKLDVFRQLVEMHLQICSAQKWCWDYRYIDMNAGPGVAPMLQMSGSPMIFLESAAKHPRLPYRALLVEEEPDSVLELRERVQRWSNVQIEQGNHSEIVPRYIRRLQGKPSGLIYHDPNGVPSFETLAEIANCDQARYLDIVVYTGATFVKRVNGWQNKRGVPYLTLPVALASINKKAWIIREPIDRAAWTFIIGSNWEQFPAWQRAGFHRINSTEGRAILERLTYREKAAPAGQQTTIPFL